MAPEIDRVPLFGCTFDRVTLDQAIAQVEAAIADKGQGLPIRLIDGRAHDVMAGSRVALTASGTATLELAFYGTPMVIVYKVNRIEKVAVPVLGIEMIGLVNIIFGRELCREFLDWRDRSADIAEEGLAFTVGWALRARPRLGIDA